MTNPTGIGVSVRRKEDMRFITGRRQLRRRHQATGHGASACSCARLTRMLRIKSIDTRQRLAMPGVVAVLTGEI